MKADTKAIQAIGDHVITHNPRVSVSHERAQRHMLHIHDVQLEDGGPYMCQLNTAPMKSQVGRCNLDKQTDNSLRLQLTPLPPP